MTIEHWFSTPILYNDFQGDLLKKIQTEIQSGITEIEKKDLTNPWGDLVKTSFKYDVGEVNDIINYSFNSLHSEILNFAVYYLNTFNIFSNSFTLKISDSWTNFSHKGDFQFDHCHDVYDGKTNKCILSGCYYYKTNSNDGDIEFMSPLNVEPPFHLRHIVYKPYVGRLLIFPSWLKHKVRVNQTDSIRISISFNIEVIN